MNVSRGWIGPLAVVVMVAPLAGCKSGTSFAKPSWWTFGGTGNADAEKLATAPPYGDAAKTADGAIPKPSASTTPYPTTTTPNGYAATGPAAAPAAAMAAAPVGDAPITYGRTPPPATAAAAALPPAAAAPLAAAAPAVATQSGPYATIPTPPPATAASTPAIDPGAAQPPDRYADLRAFPPSTPPAPAAPSAPAASQFGGAAAAAAGTVDSRYGTATGSRFSGDPSGGLAPVPSSPAPFGSGAAPAAAPASAVPTMPPARRPDPGYRPGGTSSYRPSKTILVGEPAAASAVRTAAFEAPVDPIRQ